LIVEHSGTLTRSCEMVLFMLCDSFTYDGTLYHYWFVRIWWYC